MGLFIASLLVIGTTALAAFSPGPATLVLLKNSLLGSRATALYTVLGLVTAETLYVAVALAGFGLLLTQSGEAYAIVQALGALYLVYLGVRLILFQTADSEIRTEAAPLSASTAFTEGFLTDLLNPKFILFVLAMFTQIIDPSWSFSAGLFLGFLFLATAFVVFSTLALVLTMQNVRSSLAASRSIIESSMGVILIVLGAKVVTMIQN